MERQVTEWSEREFVINRYNIWLGADMPKTISAKEIIDNGLDQVADGKASNVKILIDAKGKVVVFDNGKGISLKKSKSGRTHLMLAVNKLYTSSNYSGTEGLAGTNGVGATVSNYLSVLFRAGHISENGFTGYIFKDGVHQGENEEINKTDLSELSLVDESSQGFYVEANYGDDVIDDKLKLDWLAQYIKDRTGELPENSVIDVIVVNEDGSKNVQKYDKVPGSKTYVNSWEESVMSVPSAEIVNLRNGWRYAFCNDKNSFTGMRSIVQGSPVINPQSMNMPFVVEDQTINVSVPVVFYYKGRTSPKYTDQTKRRISIKRDDFLSALKSCKSLYQQYYSVAETAYLNKIMKDKSRSVMYSPASTAEGYKELIISEGFSANSNIKAKRKYETQACLALRGKILNVMQMDLKSAMKSDVIRDLLNVLVTQKFDKIILAPDADSDGAHICTLILGVIYKYARKYLEEGKVYLCKTPLYVFENEKTKEIEWSNDVNDCPKGYTVDVKKGLGSYTAREIKLFVTNPDTRDLWQFKFDGEDDIASLELALINGGKQWIA